MLSKSFGQNQHPIILVHGFMGWGEMKWVPIGIGVVKMILKMS